VFVTATWLAAGISNEILNGVSSMVVVGIGEVYMVAASVHETLNREVCLSP